MSAPTPAADPVAERLTGMLERHQLTLQETGSAETYVCRLLASAADIPATVAAVEAVLALTRKGDGTDRHPSRILAVGELRAALTSALLGEGKAP